MTGSRRSIGAGTGRRAAIVCGALVLTVAWLITLSPAARAACPITDPACLVDDVQDGVTDDVQEVVDGVQDVTDPIVDDVEETVDPILDDVEEVVPVVEDVEDVVDDVIDDVEEVVEDTTGIDVDPPTVGEDPGQGAESGPAPTEPAGPGTPRDPGDPETPGGPGAADDPASGAKTDGAAGAGAGAFLTTAASVGGTTIETESAVARLAIKAPAFFDRIGGIAGIAAALAFPLLLALMAGTFVLLQNRIDRRDPRLALAPVRPDDLRFE
jgi:hypothetical protein